MPSGARLGGGGVRGFPSPGGSTGGAPPAEARAAPRDVAQALAALEAARREAAEARAAADAARAEAAAARSEAEAARRQAQEYLDQLRRLQADFTNYRRRMMEEQRRWRQDAEAELVRALLPVLDNLERALAAGGDAGHPVVQGVAMIHRQFLDVLRQVGVEPMEAEGQPFDPHRHEAVARVETADRPDGTVIEVFQRGYLYRGRTLRPAMVKVAVAPAGTPAATAPPSADAAGQAGADPARGETGADGAGGAAAQDGGR
ncbi:MAG: nucleotide exchange factor GrpE [Bacillota bacterium]|nr:MAG: nucleotide exchange factor GrpE [Bacillota bacterium]